MAKTKVKCFKETCGATFEVEEDNIDKKQKYMQCPFCGNITDNPFYEGEE